MTGNELHYEIPWFVLIAWGSAGNMRSWTTLAVACHLRNPYNNVVNRYELQYTVIMTKAYKDWDTCRSYCIHVYGMLVWSYVNTLRPRQNGRHFADAIFKCIFLKEVVSISIEISLKFVPKGPINNIPALVQIMARRRPGDKPLSEPMMVNLPTHICVTRPQWVKK